MISLINVDIHCTAEFYILIHVHKNPTQLIAEDLLHEIANKLVNQHKTNTGWATASQFVLYFHMHVFF